MTTPIQPTALSGPTSGEFVQVGPQALFFKPGDILLFFNDRMPADPGTGTEEVPAINRVAILTGFSGALFVERTHFGRRIRRIPAQLIATLKNPAIRRPPVAERHGDLVAEYFIKHSRKLTTTRPFLAAAPASWSEMSGRSS